MRMAQADRVTAVVLLMLGLAMLAGGWTMERLEFRRIHPASIPGLVPMILGGLLALCAVLLWHSARPDAAGRTTARQTAPFLTGGSWSRLALTAALAVVYAIGLIGWLPFTAATFAFVFAFAAVFSWPGGAGRWRAQIKTLLSALVLGVCVAFGTALLFEHLFLVRLP